jgi:hypothetical protein
LAARTIESVKVLNFLRETLNRRNAVAALTLIVCTLFGNDASAQIQQAWVAHYNNGITNGTNQAVKMALDANGNIYVTGFSQNTNSQLGYATIKYAPNGNQLWAARYDSTNDSTATPTALALDSSNNVFVTGTALTIKYDPNGNQLWTAPYAGAALSVDTNGNSVVTGINTSFGTVKLNSNGSNIWSVAYPSPYGPGLAQQVVIGSDGSICIAGSYTFTCPDNVCNLELLVLKYDPNGNQLWTANYALGNAYEVQVEGAALDSMDNLYFVANFVDNIPYIIVKYGSNGNVDWADENPTRNGSSRVRGLSIDGSSNVLITGLDTNYPGYPAFGYGTYAINPDGDYIWTNVLLSIPQEFGAGTSITVDSANNSYVTGYTPDTNSFYDIATVKYDPNGNQVWEQRFSGPGDGNDVGNAIAVDKNGNIYVAGYDTTAAGGTEMVLIKYSPLTLQRRSDGTVLLETQGSPGESFDIEASADLLNWLDLGTVPADTNGLMQFDDTNAPQYGARFYYTKPQ